MLREVKGKIRPVEELGHEKGVNSGEGFFAFALYFLYTPPPPSLCLFGSTSPDMFCFATAEKAYFLKLPVILSNEQNVGKMF